MPKRWSKLKKPIEDLFVQDLSLRIYCTDIRTTPENVGTFAEALGVLTFRLAKEVIWNFPSQFIDWETYYPDGGNPYSYRVSDLNGLLRSYLDTPKDSLLFKEFSRDYFGLTNILKAADRRIGLPRLEKHFQDFEQDSVDRVLAARRCL